MVIDGGEGSEMFLEPFLKHPCRVLYVLFFTVSLGTLKPSDFPTFLNDLLALGGHQEVPDGDAHLKMYLYSHLTTYILKAFTKPLVTGHDHVDVAVYVVVVVVVVVVVWDEVLQNTSDLHLK